MWVIYHPLWCCLFWLWAELVKLPLSFQFPRWTWKSKWTHSARAARTPSTSPMYSRFERSTYKDKKSVLSDQCWKNKKETNRRKPFSPRAEDSPLVMMWSSTASYQQLVHKYFSMLMLTWCESDSKGSFCARIRSESDNVKYCLFFFNKSHLVWASAQAAGESGEGSTAAGRPPSPSPLSPWTPWPPCIGSTPSPECPPSRGSPSSPSTWLLSPFTQDGDPRRFEHSAGVSVFLQVISLMMVMGGESNSLFLK